MAPEGESCSVDLLPALGKLLQRWQDNHQQGLAALVLAQQQLALLAQAGAPANKATLDQLHRMAPSARLADYAKYGQRVLTTGAPEAEQLQRGFAALQGCVEEACSLAAEMDRLVVASSEAWQSSAYGNQSSSCDNLDSATISALQVGEGGEQREADGDGGPGSGRLPRGLGGGGGGGGGSAEEQCLVATGLLHAVRLELQLMGRVAGAVGLDTGQGELQTYVSMWQLQPFLDDGMVQELVRLSASD